MGTRTVIKLRVRHLHSLATFIRVVDGHFIGIRHRIAPLGLDANDRLEVRAIDHDLGGPEDTPQANATLEDWYISSGEQWLAIVRRLPDLGWVGGFDAPKSAGL